MPADARKVTPEDLIPDAEYAKVRRERRAALLPVKRLRRVELGPICTIFFESYETMLFQIQEMLLVEKGGEAQIADELAAYNPMIPNGSELSATVMIEIEDGAQRERALSRLGGIEDRMFLTVGGERISGIADPTRENTSPQGKASSVQFLRFPLTPRQKSAFRTPGAQIIVGIDHSNYGHMAVMPEAVRAALAGDLG